VEKDGPYGAALLQQYADTSMCADVQMVLLFVFAVFRVLLSASSI